MAAKRRSKKAIERIKKEADRLGYTDWRSLDKAWKKQKAEVAKFNAWRNSEIKRLMKETGASRKELEDHHAVPGRMKADLSEVRSKAEFPKRSKAMQRERAKFDRRAAETGVVRHRDRAARRDFLEVEQGLTHAQSVLKSRLNEAVATTAEEWEEMVRLISEMTDEDIIRFYEMDDGEIYRILKAISPKLMARMNKTPETISVSENAENLDRFMEILKTAMRESA